MRTLLLVGSLAAGVLLFVYELYCRRESNQNEQPHGGRGRPISDDDYFIAIGGPEPGDVERRSKIKAPGPDEMCAICLETLIRMDAEKKYAIIALPHCGHWFHQKCAIRLLDYHPMCPVCRVAIDSSSLRSTPVRLSQVLNEETQGDSNNTSSKSNGSHLRSKRD